MSAAPIYPHSGVCANCGRDRDDLFWHAEAEAFYCADVFRCEARAEILQAASPSREATDPQRKAVTSAP